MVLSILWGKQSWTVSFPKDTSIKTIKTVKLTAFILTNISAEIWFYFFFFFLDCCQKENAKLNKFKNLQLFWSVISLPILHIAIPSYEIFKLVSLQHRRKREIAIDASCF